MSGMSSRTRPERLILMAIRWYRRQGLYSIHSQLASTLVKWIPAERLSLFHGQSKGLSLACRSRPHGCAEDVIRKRALIRTSNVWGSLVFTRPLSTHYLLLFLPPFDVLLGLLISAKSFPRSFSVPPANFPTVGPPTPRPRLPVRVFEALLGLSRMMPFSTASFLLTTSFWLALA